MTAGGGSSMRTLQHIALALVIIGALNWGLIGLFQFDLVAAIFGGQASGLSRVIYTLVGLSGLFSLSIFIRIAEDGPYDARRIDTRNAAYQTEFAEDDDPNNR